ncbi:peptidoglycan/LPS O-acetylase OafA/YrhL [Duganella sp. 1224]|uniref:acyltransferase family protein n=1 Tax=Duganella sp. 1224 TaxID=2587052 RepID=UPI0015C783E0|nr:acyltransferase [Duganella sp. 1224]NYE62170.1 peptidoglycan/LPS O-acetylase OafA/YrhL [Duganella sp. 1224]
MTPTLVRQPHLAYLDGWRGLAILAVLAGHFLPMRGINLGRMGVELFFVLSGRLMCQILFIQGTTLGEFYRRRLARIVPGLLVFVTLYALYLTTVEHQPPSLNAVASTLLFYTNYLGASNPEQAPGLEHLWSLAIEEHSYILLSLLMVLTRHARRAALPVIATLAVAAIANGMWQTYALERDYYEVYWRSDVRGASILISAALCLHEQRHPWRLSGWRLAALGFAGVVLNTNPVPDAIKYSLGTLCFAIVVNHAAALPPLTINLLSSKLFAGIGITSFSIYLWQQPFFQAAEMGRRHGWMLTCALLVGITSYFLVEKPARRWLNQRRLTQAGLSA